MNQRILRDYQCEASDKTLSMNKAGMLSGLIVLATGLGKTVIAANIVRAPIYNRTIFLTHREELLNQSAEVIGKEVFGNQWEFNVGIIKAERFDISKKLTVASIQTLHRRLDRIPANHFDLVISDEAHLTGSASWTKCLKYFTPKLSLGLTATPHRLDGISLADNYEQIIIDKDISFGINQGYLVELDGVQIRTDTNLNKVRTTGGELNAGDLEKLVNTPKRNNLIADSWLKYTPGQTTLGFCVDVKHTVDITKTFQNRGIKASFVCADQSICPDRKYRVDAFKAGDVDVMFNCEILTTGFDYPAISSVIMARPTKSLTLYLQCLDDQTEILTNNGWRNLTTIKKSDKSAAFNIKTGEISWQKINEIFKRKRNENEDMYSVDLPGIDIRVTDGHRMIQSKRFGRKRTYLPYQFVEAKSFNGHSKIPVSGLQQSKGLSLTNDELVFLGLFLSDGHINKTKNQLYIAQSVHQKWNKDIVECLNNCGIKYKLSTLTRKTQYSNSSTMNYYYVGVNEIRRFLPWLSKDLNANYEEITPFQLEYLVKGINLGDGNKTEKIDWIRSTFTISTGNKKFGENLQSICVRKGFRCNMVLRLNPIYNTINYQLHIEPFKLDRKLSFSNDGRDTFSKETVWRDETVWCISNDLQTLITRRNGKVAILGNCIGRATRPIVPLHTLVTKEERIAAIQSSSKAKTTILDIVDITGHHSLVNTWSLDKDKPTEEKVFKTRQQKLAIIAGRTPKISHDLKEDKKIVLLALPKVTINHSGAMLEPASPAQLKWIADAGYDVVNNVFTKADASEIISQLPATDAQVFILRKAGYDVSGGVNRGQAGIVIKEIEAKKQRDLEAKFTQTLPFTDLD